MIGLRLIKKPYFKCVTIGKKKFFRASESENHLQKMLLFIVFLLNNIDTNLEKVKYDHIAYCFVVIS